ncbi:MAG: TAXI family TRAP transporter solute-binding subunit [Deltaproteobacteria bacterium]|nr:TAXI family TRAP transporter solute-binding subunit [Deltaproteobacteria bacterium]
MGKKKIKRQRFAAVMCLVALGAILGMADQGLASEKKIQFKMGAVPSGSGWYFYASQMATVLSQRVPGMEITVRETGGTRENTLRMAKKELDIGLSEALVSFEAYRGVGRFKDKPIANHRLLWNVATTYMHWAVSQDSGIKTFEDLAGKSFNPSTIGGGGEYITEKVFEVIGATPKFFRAKIADAAEAVKDGRIAGFSYNGTLPVPTFVEVHAARPIRILSLSEDQVKKITEKYPFLVKQIIPANTYKNVPEATTVGLYLNVSASMELADEDIYTMVKAYWKNLPEIARAFPLVTNAKPEETTANATAPLHRGALKYYREIGVAIPAGAIPPEAK